MATVGVKFNRHMSYGGKVRVAGDTVQVKEDDVARLRARGVLDEPAAPAQSDEPKHEFETELGLDTATTALLREAGWNDIDALRAASAEDINAVDGVGAGRFKKINEALGNPFGE